MKTLLITVVLFSLLLVSGANAQFVSDQCSFENMDVLITTQDVVHVKLVYNLECSGSTANAGQVTKLLFTIPVEKVSNVEASDSFGSMKVLEGPEYVSASSDGSKTTIGVIFRKGLEITDSKKSYPLTVEFDTNSLVESSESALVLRPGEVIGNPKVTIITTGVTETVLQNPGVDVTIRLGDGSSIQSVTPSVCGINAGNVECKQLTATDLSALEIRWAGSTSGDIAGRIEAITRKYMPTVSTQVRGLFGMFSGFLQGK